MPIYPYGALIRQRREELGYTQEELSEGICSVPTLSRIENGERLPSKEHSEMLLQRLGLADVFRIQYVTEQTFELHDLKYRIRQALIDNNKVEANSLLDEFEEKAGTGDCISNQFLLLHRTILDEQLSPNEKQKRYLTAIRITRPDFNPDALPPILSYEEIRIINNYAVEKANSGDLEAAIALLYSLSRLYRENAINPEEALRTRLMVVYNLSKYLGLSGRYDECIAVCHEGIQIARETGKCRILDRLFYNKAWALLKRGDQEDRPEAKECLRLAICAAEVLDLRAYVLHYRKFMQDNFGSSTE